MSTYTIQVSDGRTERALCAEYATREEAAEALRRVYGWETIVLSSSYSVSYSVDSIEACSAYETQVECDVDQDDGAYAPRIVEVRS